MDVIDDPNIDTGKSFPKIIIGLLLLAAAVAFIFWHEKEPVQRYKVYMDGPGSTVVLAAPQISSANEGKLVYFTGPVASASLLRDRQLGVSANAVKLHRQVLMYQWKEEKTTEPVTDPETNETKDKEVYKYSKDWLEDLFETLSFKKPVDHETKELRVNPSRMLFESNEIVSSNIRVGDFKLPQSVVKDFNNYEKVEVDEKLLEKFPEEWKSRVSVVEGDYYIGKGKPEKPRVGDYRISYEAVKPGDVVTAVGKQAGDSIEPYISHYNNAIMEFKVGNYPLEAMFPNVKDGNQALEWGGRIAAIIIIFIGAKLLLLGLNSSFSALLITLILAPITFGFSWTVDARINFTLLGISGIALLIAIISLLSKRSKAPGISSRDRVDSPSPEKPQKETREEKKARKEREKAEKAAEKELKKKQKKESAISPIVATTPIANPIEEKDNTEILEYEQDQSPEASHPEDQIEVLTETQDFAEGPAVTQNDEIVVEAETMETPSAETQTFEEVAPLETAADMQGSGISFESVPTLTESAPAIEQPSKPLPEPWEEDDEGVSAPKKSVTNKDISFEFSESMEEENKS